MLTSLVTTLLSIQGLAAPRPDQPWTLFPDGAVPGERYPEPIGPESSSGGDDEHISNVTVPTLTPMLAAHNPTGAAVIIAPGGAYKFVTWDKEGVDIARWLNSLNISAFILKYRVPGRDWLPFGEAPLMDAQRAVGLVRARSAPLKLHASRIGFLGFSAGGHLTGRLAATSGGDRFRRAYPRVDASDDLSCRPDFTLMIYPWCLIGPVGECSQLTNTTVNVPVSQGNPPGFLAQAEDDPVHVENSLLYFLALKTRGAPPSELHVYPKGGHGYGRCTVGGSKGMTEAVCTWPERAARFLRTLLEEGDMAAPTSAAGRPALLADAAVEEAR